MIEATCKICNKELPSMFSLSNHIGAVHRELGVEKYYLQFEVLTPDVSFCKSCGKRMLFRGLRLGYGAPYCGGCGRTQDSERAAKISAQVKQRWREGAYAGEETARKHRQYYERLTTEQKTRLLLPLISTGHWKYKTGKIGDYTYIGSYEKSFVTSYTDCEKFAIIAQNHVIHYYYEGVWRLYFLDFVLRNLETQSTVFVEVKGTHPGYLNELTTGRAIAKYGAAYQICQEHDMEFWFVTEKDQRLKGCGVCTKCKTRNQNRFTLSKTKQHD